MTSATVIPIRREFQVHRFDPIKHGVLSRHAVLPWEDEDAFENILRGLLIEHAPQGPDRLPPRRGPRLHHLAQTPPAASRSVKASKPIS